MSSYHGWTHAPKSQGGTDPIPGSADTDAYFRAYLIDDLTNLSGTDQIVDWHTGWELGGEAGVFQPKTTALSNATTSDKVRRLDLLVPGRIEMCWGFEYSLTGDAANGDVYSHFLSDNNPVFGSNYQDTHAAPSGVQGEGLLISNYSRIYPLLDPFASGTQTIQFQWRVSWSGPTTGETVQSGFVDVYWRPLA